MSKQVTYIVQAHLLLAALAGTYLFLKNIPADATVEQHLNLVDITDTISHNPEIAEAIRRGKTVFMSHCASCHRADRDLTGPALKDFEQRGPWADRNKLYEWIKNPSAFMQKDKYTRDLQSRYVSMMTAFPDMSNEQIDDIVSYINSQ